MKKLQIYSEKQGLEMRPHHTEGAMRIISRALSSWDYVRDGANEEPMTVMEMFFDAANYIISTTPDRTKREIEARWRGNDNYQKIYRLLSERYSSLQEDSKKDPDLNPDRDLINQGHAEMYQGLKRAYDENSEASVTFINGYDFVCHKCIGENGGQPLCLLMKLIKKHEEPQMLIDDEVRAAHNWEYGKPYKIREILETFYIESMRRKAEFLFFYDQTKDEEFMKRWRQDVRQSKTR
jgi:hypothetical protein